MQSQQRNGMTHKQQGPYGSNWIIVVFYSVVVCVHHASIQPRLYSLNNYIISLLCFCLRCLCILFWNWMKSISTKKSKKKNYIVQGKVTQSSNEREYSGSLFVFCCICQMHTQYPQFYKVCRMHTLRNTIAWDILFTLWFSYAYGFSTCIIWLLKVYTQTSPLIFIFFLLHTGGQKSSNHFGITLFLLFFLLNEPQCNPIYVIWSLAWEIHSQGHAIFFSYQSLNPSNNNC